MPETNKQDLITIAAKGMGQQNFDCLAVGVVDFDDDDYSCFELTQKSRITTDNDYLYFDLASLTKVLTLAATYLKHQHLFDKELELLLNHRSSLPEWGRLSRSNWKEQVLEYPIKKDKVLYSDFGALRLMLELEKKSKKSLKELCDFFWDAHICHWKDLKRKDKTPNSGMRKGQSIHGEVHDDNAFVLDQFCSHAGLFGTIEGVSQSLLNLNKETDLLKKMIPAMKKKGEDDRYVNGWDTITNPEETLAGQGAGPLTFGHLGFTGTSIWIDPEQKKGSVILSNATQNHWYDRDHLNTLRKQLGEAIWTYV